MWKFRKKGIALLITMFFIIAITVAVGVGLKQINEASWHVENESFMLQTSVLLDDVLTLLQNSKELDMIVKDNSGDDLFAFLSQASFIPFESSGIKVIIELKSARAKFNPNLLADTNGSAYRVDALKRYVDRYRVNSEYVDFLLDIMGGIKEDMSYNSDIFYEKPYLFRDYIVSLKHLDEVNDFYIKRYHENSLKNIDFKNLFYCTKEKNTLIDVNYATPQTWELMLGVDALRAQELHLGGGYYKSLEDLLLSEDERLALEKFGPSFFEPYLDVRVEIIQNENNSVINFEYDMKKKQGYNFVYEI
ncbi:hypothetical protein KKG72_10365 [bacterium]|nr:hypothetical protein [bacterium]MBU1994454.1 hypothetical protein [bacterium]